MNNLVLALLLALMLAVALVRTPRQPSARFAKAFAFLAWVARAVALCLCLLLAVACCTHGGWSILSGICGIAVGVALGRALTVLLAVATEHRLRRAVPRQ
jgi:hypothetical protein